MPFTHIAIFKWKTNDAEAADAVANALRDLIPQLSGVENYICGSDIGLIPSSYDFAVVGTFTTRNDFENYRDHPEHQRILHEMIMPNLDRRTVAQLEN